jgi:hypothetical protein
MKHLVAGVVLSTALLSQTQTGKEQPPNNTDAKKPSSSKEKGKKKSEPPKPPANPKLQPGQGPPLRNVAQVILKEPIV